MSDSRSENRSRFPRGLLQPAGSYRFAVDSLLLACFLKPAGEDMLLDVGAGCGVVALATLCLHPRIRAFGVEREPGLVTAARNNAGLLGFGDRLHMIEADIGVDDIFTRQPAPKECTGLRPGAFGLVLANPPFRVPDRGRLPQSPVRQRALFEEKNTLAHFCHCAAMALKPQGRFGILHDAGRLDFLLDTLEEAGMAPVRLLPVRAHPGKAPFRILAEAVLKSTEAPPPLLCEPPLTLHAAGGGPKKYSREAASFCPFLADF